MSARRIVNAFDAWRGKREPLVLATVYETLGSTYSKAGHRILIAGNGDYQGLVSGGCLEGDLGERARRVLAEGAPAAVTYDMRDEADALWGLGVGCNGLIRVFLQPLLPDDDYAPFGSIAERWLGDARAATAVVVGGEAPDAPLGGTVLLDGDGARAFGLAPQRASLLEAGCRRALATGSAELVRGAVDVLYAPLLPIARVLILGAGPDALPLVAIAAELGWRVTIADHRDAYLEGGGFASAEAVLRVDPRRLTESVALERYDAIIVMSHHLMTDEAYLAAIADAPAAYVGVLGPPARKARLLEALGERAAGIAGRLVGPVGLDIGADSPESIALSIAADLQRAFSGRRVNSR